MSSSSLCDEAGREGTESERCIVKQVSLSLLFYHHLLLLLTLQNIIIIIIIVIIIIIITIISM